MPISRRLNTDFSAGLIRKDRIFCQIDQGGQVVFGRFGAENGHRRCPFGQKSLTLRLLRCSARQSYGPPRGRVKRESRANRELSRNCKPIVAVTWGKICPTTPMVSDRCTNSPHTVKASRRGKPGDLPYSHRRPETKLPRSGGDEQKRSRPYYYFDYWP